ncbi:unnamed protein product [Toxocara canis]|uniref:Alpha-mann_mid domain-containing protein n=1 Tax=Toxocara canis TaxID=6265 RepID=A0A183UAQ1_TOXCA|nr:unnamed protein product [Toxocara canis]
MKRWQRILVCAVTISALLVIVQQSIVDTSTSRVAKVSGHQIRMTNNERSTPNHVDVFVVLHSHVDPGWLQTFDEYYDNKVACLFSVTIFVFGAIIISCIIILLLNFFVHSILNNVVGALDQYKDLRLVKEGRFEVTGGSWVMTDEATPYFWASIDNMIVGHQFLLKRLNTSPKASCAQQMAGQYRQLQPYYNSRSVLVAAGDDFAYSDARDLPQLYRVVNIQVRFGTVSDYFSSLDETSLPLMSGDFFPRSSQRAGSRKIFFQAKMRGLDLLRVAAKAEDVSIVNEIARRDLALFQHHDAITGTSRRLVMLDYFNRLCRSLHWIFMEHAKFITQLQRVSNENRSLSSIDIPPNNMTFELLPQNVLRFRHHSERLYLTVFNQNSFRSRQLITVRTTTHNVAVIYNGREIDAQVGPLFDYDGINNDLFRLSFYVTLDAFVVAEVQLMKQSIPPALTKLSTIGCYNCSRCQQK